MTGCAASIAPLPARRRSVMVLLPGRRRILQLQAAINMVDLATALKSVGYRLIWDREHRSLAIQPTHDD